MYVVLVLKISQEKPIIKTGVIDPIKDALITNVVFRAMYVNELKIVTLKIERRVIKKKFFL